MCNSQTVRGSPAAAPRAHVIVSNFIFQRRSTIGSVKTSLLMIRWNFYVCTWNYIQVRDRWTDKQVCKQIRDACDDDDVHVLITNDVLNGPAMYALRSFTLSLCPRTHTYAREKAHSFSTRSTVRRQLYSNKKKNGWRTVIACL